MTIFQLRSVLKVITKERGGGGQKTPNFDYAIYGWSLSHENFLRKKRCQIKKWKTVFVSFLPTFLILSFVQITRQITSLNLKL